MTDLMTRETVRCEHAPSNDPRKAGFCCKCARPLDSMVVIGQQAKRVRNEEYEHMFLEQVDAEVMRRFGIETGSFAQNVKMRLRMGENRYGNAFMDADLLLELQEESWDGAAYPVLEVQKWMASDREDSGAHWMFEAAVYAAMVDFCARMARAARSEA